MRATDPTSFVTAGEESCELTAPGAAGRPRAGLGRSGAGLTRRAALLLPLLVAACASEQPQYFAPLHYGYLPPIGLNVANIEIEQHFIPSGVAPDVTQQDPVSPSDALRAMAQDRLKALGSAGRAVFIIQDASLVRHGDTINGTMDVLLNVYPGPNMPRAGFAEARVARQYTGDLDDLPARLYDMTKAMMQAMNVEFEYQIRRRLHDWLASGTAVVPPVAQQPLDSSGVPTMPPPGPAGAGNVPPPGAYPPPGGYGAPPPAPYAPGTAPPPGSLGTLPMGPSGSGSMPPPVPLNPQ